MARKITNDDIQKKLNTLSLDELLGMLNNYSTTNAVDLEQAKQKLITNDLQNKLIANDVNKVCPQCKGNHIVKNGTRANGIKEFKCKDCGKKFTVFTNTILEKSKLRWDIWIKVSEMVLNNMPLEHMQQILISDYGMADVDIKSVFLWKHKIINALANLPMPKLTGIIQIDETFFRESQKGSRYLESTIKGEKRYPRYGRRPSKYGVMGNEFANVVCMVDLNGYAVAKVIGLGKLDVETFTELFDEYIDNPSYLCSDGNLVYKKYCDIKNIPLYIKPSNYVDVIQKAGYVTPDWSDVAKAQATDDNNMKILTKLYNDNLIDYIYHRGELSYKEFYHLKNANSLSLARVNQFHSELKRFLEYNTRAVSTKYLSDYIGFQVFLRNWKASHGHYPSSNKDAESIFIDILKGKTTYTTNDIDEAKLELPMVTDKYMALLKQHTDEIRKVTKNPYFKYDEEDNVISFNKRKYLDSLPAYKLDQLRKQYKIPRYYARYCVISELLKEPDITETIMLLINEDKHIKVSDEDREYLASQAYKAV